MPRPKRAKLTTMVVQVVCPYCSASLDNDTGSSDWGPGDDLRPEHGRVVACPTCGKDFKIDADAPITTA